MTIRGAGQDILFLLIVTALVRPAGTYLALVFTGGRTWLDPIAQPIERALYRLARVDAALEMTWAEYATAFVVFGLAGTVVLYAILRSQAPLATPLTPDLAANTAISFSTTTTWQAYAGETTMRYPTQLVGLAGQNFLAGAVGLAVGIAFVRGLARDGATTIGNFWVDVVRAVLWVLLPLSVVGGIALMDHRHGAHGRCTHVCSAARARPDRRARAHGVRRAVSERASADGSWRRGAYCSRARLDSHCHDDVTLAENCRASECGVD
jgi:K+-transporting ATPase A subunit